MSPPRALFVAGSTGAVGRTVMRLGEARGVDLVPHVRPKTAAQGGPIHPRAAVLDLADASALDDALADRTTILQLIGTMRRRFARGDTYETSDIGTTHQLLEAARRIGSIDHFVLLSSVGAGKPFGAYLQAKARAETLVRAAGVSFTILRPSAFIGEGHSVPRVFKTIARAIGARTWEPIDVEDLAGAILHVAVRGAPKNATLEGAALWEVVEQAR